MTNNDDDGHLLARIDERVRHIEHMVEDFVTQMEFIPISSSCSASSASA